MAPEAPPPPRRIPAAERSSADGRVARRWSTLSRSIDFSNASCFATSAADTPGGGVEDAGGDEVVGRRPGGEGVVDAVADH